MAREVGDLWRELEDSESEVSEDERSGDDESALGMATFAQRKMQMQTQMQKRKFRRVLFWPQTTDMWLLGKALPDWLR